MNQSSPAPNGLPMDRDAGPFNPPRAITQLRAANPVSPMTFPDGHQGWLVTGYSAARALLADTRFSSRQDLAPLHVPYEIEGMPPATEPSPQEPGLFISMDPPDHTRLRKMLTGAFTVRRMKQLEEHIVEIVEQRLEAMSRMTPEVDLIKEFALPVPVLVICEMLGVPFENRETFQADTTKFMEKDVVIEEKIAAYTSLTTFLGELVASKRAEPADDLLSDLAGREDIGLDEVTGVAFLLLLAGYETTTNMLGLGTFALLRHPEQLAELRANPELASDAVEEILRYCSVADIFYRYATQDIELEGTTIPEGSTVVVSLLAANRDPERFADPDTLDIRRTARGHLSFGHGVHQCLGQQLARIEMRAGFTALLRRFPDLQLAVPADDVPLRTNMNIYGVHTLPVTWTRTAP